MKEKKLKLEDFKVQSFVTSDAARMQGGGGTTIGPDEAYTLGCSMYCETQYSCVNCPTDNSCNYTYATCWTACGTCPSDCTGSCAGTC